MGNSCCAGGRSVPESAAETQPVPILVLGTGEAGKSTICRQLRKIYGRGFDEKYKAKVKPAIVYNILNGMQIILERLPSLNLTLSAAGEKSKKEFLKFLETNKNVLTSSTLIPPVALRSLKVLMQDKAFLDAIQKLEEFHAPSAWPWYVKKAIQENTTWGTKEWKLETEDILKVRIRSVGASKTLFELNEQKFELRDLGGQTSERANWFKALKAADTKAVFYIISLGDYNQKAFEDDVTDRLEDAINTWERIVNLPESKHLPIFVFFNKIDILARKFCDEKIPIPLLPDRRIPPVFNKNLTKAENLNKVKHWFEEITAGAINSAERQYDPEFNFLVATEDHSLRETLTKISGDLLSIAY